MIELYYAPTPNGHRARLVLAEAEIPHRLRSIDLWKGEQKAETFLKVNPLGAIPVLVDTEGPNGDTVVLSQSIAILFYVAEKCGRFIPRDRVRRLEMTEWLMVAASDVAGANSAINQLRRSAPEQSEANIAFFESRLLRYLTACDHRLSGRRYLVDEFSLADIGLYPFVHARRPLIEGTALTNLKRWIDDLGQRPAVVRAMAS